MTAYLLKRLIATIPILVLVTVVVFAIMQVLPGDPARMILGQEATPQALEAVRVRLGLDRPVVMQYLGWVGGILRGDLGRSMMDNTPVSRAIGHALPVTIQITLLALLIALAIGVPAGVISATRRGGIWDALASLASPILIQASLSVAAAILVESALSFLGLGVQPPTPSWGSMLRIGTGYIETAPWVSFWPGMAIFLTVLGINLFGDGLRDALDPKD